MEKLCTVEGCGRKHAARGYCQKHHYRFLKHGDPNKTAFDWHGLSKTWAHSIRHSMISRCYNPKMDSYKNYGARGITVCARWLESVQNFYDDMAPRPSPLHQIDRIDNDGPYCKENCRWSTPAENMHNTSKTKLSMEIARRIRASTERSGPELAKEFGVSRTVINAIRRGEIWKETDEINATATAESSRVSNTPDRLPPESSCPTPLQL